MRVIPSACLHYNYLTRLLQRQSGHGQHVHNSRACVPTKLCFQKQGMGQICPRGCSLLTPVLKGECLGTKGIIRTVSQWRVVIIVFTSIPNSTLHTDSRKYTVREFCFFFFLRFSSKLSEQPVTLPASITSYLVRSYPCKCLFSLLGFKLLEGTARAIFNVSICSLM